jgi:hypothetical protein
VRALVASFAAGVTAAGLIGRRVCASAVERAPTGQVRAVSIRIASLELERITARFHTGVLIATFRYDAPS